jgi:very-short-patch-repair endonuclease
VKLPRLRAKTRSSRLEARFALYWSGLGGPELQREFVFHPERKWRADFAHVESRTLIEVEGGIFIKGGGRHNRAAGFIADAEKYLAAFLAGWNVVRLTEAQITAPNVERIIRRVRFDIGTQAYADTPSKNSPRRDAFQHERTDPPPQHPGIANAQGHS